MPSGKYPRSPLVDRLWAKVDRKGPDECWPWIAAKGHNGYGMIQYQGRPRRAHRLVMELGGVSIPKGVFVCHHCDNPPCCNPAHLFLGSAADNMRDRDVKGRVAAGERAARAKLTWAIVDTIRSEYDGSFGQMTKMARRYGVTQRVIKLVVTGQTWRSHAKAAVDPVANERA